MGPNSINPIDPPRLLGGPIGSALFKVRPEDFQVEEILGFVPSGDGEHCFVWLEKTGRNSNDVATELARKLGIRKRLVSHCGLKDKEAVTRQWFSLHLPGAQSPTKNDLAIEGVRILEITRNLRKLRRGAHDGNRFTIRLRSLQFSSGQFSKMAVKRRWQQMVARGVPNYFGAQRFGRNGNNIKQAVPFLLGELTIRDRDLRGILISAARSFIFNACVAERVHQGNWDVPHEGEVFGFSNNRSIVIPDNLRGDEVCRFNAGKIELTAPLWGVGDVISRGRIKSIEEDVAQRFSELIQGLTLLNLKQERRVIRLMPQLPSLTFESNTDCIVRFDLPKGTYATTLLRELVDFR